MTKDFLIKLMQCFHFKQLSTAVFLLSLNLLKIKYISYLKEAIIFDYNEFYFDNRFFNILL